MTGTELTTFFVFSSYNLWELIPFALLGVLGGLWGPTFVRLCMQWVYVHRRAANLHKHPVAEAAAAGALCAVVACLVPVMKHNSNVILGERFRQDPDADLRIRG